MRGADRRAATQRTGDLGREPEYGQQQACMQLVCRSASPSVAHERTTGAQKHAHEVF